MIRPAATFIGYVAGEFAFSPTVQRALGFDDRDEPLAEMIAGGIMGAALAWAIARIVWRER
ncbi:hypothetical protein ASF22_05015 [Methylobacterium sp. Leaf87]|uniref:hypothetical protein n=1 Tax=Methylobacterium sp. Leaf87 TaxID=1736243 RepID=UPI0007004559|nr:hypothetical protein [Methylobacterium sp. Leaf87]KQO66031.1 hypothetical protein ASF22_05015 [Methylobacterium sp. Leaf87]